jgi:hypothetical protein
MVPCLVSARGVPGGLCSTAAEGCQRERARLATVLLDGDMHWLDDATTISFITHFAGSVCLTNECDGGSFNQCHREESQRCGLGPVSSSLMREQHSLTRESRRQHRVTPLS